MLDGEGAVKINGEFQYYEARRVVFSNKWITDNRNERLDRYGNQLVPKSIKIKEWQKSFAYDASYLYMEPLKFKLNKGKNRITLINTNGEILLGRVYLENLAEPITYEDYRTGKADEGRSSKINVIIEAEDLAWKNKSSIRPAFEKT